MLHTPALRDDREIYYLSMEFMDLKGTELAMKKCLTSNVKFQYNTILKDQLISLKNIGTNETQCFARKVGNKIKHNKEKVMERVVKFIMNLKIKDTMKDLQSQRKTIKERQEEVDRIVRPGTYVNTKYKTCVKTKLENNWKRVNVK